MSNQDFIDRLTSKNYNKIQKASTRQRKRNPDMYKAGAVEGEDYISCPVSGIRFTSIRKGHITGTLGTTEEEFYKHFPDIKGKVATVLKNNIAAGLKELAYNKDGTPYLDETGKHLTKHEVSKMKSVKTLNEIDPVTGKRRYDMLGEKTRNTHMNKVDEYGMNGYQRIAKDAIVKSTKTKMDNGLVTKSRLSMTVKERYERIIEHLIRNIKVDGCISEDVKLGLMYSESDNMQIDHKYSISAGFKNKVSPLLVGSVLNCEILPWKDNLNKGDDCSITLDQLLNIHSYTKEASEDQFEKIKKVLEEDISNNTVHSTLSVFERAGVLEVYNLIRKINTVTKL